MKKILILLLFPFIASAQTFETCLVTGRLYLQDGTTKDSIKVMVVKTVARGTSRPIVIQTKRTFYTDSNGNITMPLLRNSDVTFESNAYGLTGKTLTIPNTATATLESLVPTATVPPLYAVAVPNLTLVDSSGGSYPTDSVRIGSGLKAIAPTDGGGTPTIISTATGSGATYGDSIKVAHDIANGKGDADSLKAAYDSLAAHLARISATEQVADGAIQKSDSASLHAQKFADRPTRTEVTDTLNANVVRSEVDPTATAKAQAVVADSLKPFPTGLKAAGPLGYVWGVLPGGAQGWKPDSAGGGSVDTTRILPVGGTSKNATGRLGLDVVNPANGFELNRNIVQHKDSSANIGRVITPRIDYDTVGVYQVDTLGAVQFWQHERPLYQNAGAGVAGLYKIGVAVIRFSCSRSQFIGIRADTTNGVVMLAIQSESDGARIGTNLAGGYIQESFVGTGAVLTRELEVSSSGASAPNINWMAGNRDANNYGYTYLAAQLIGVSDRAGVIRLRVTYLIPTANTSNEPVRITDQ